MNICIDGIYIKDLMQDMYLYMSNVNMYICGQWPEVSDFVAQIMYLWPLPIHLYLYVLSV